MIQNYKYFKRHKKIIKKLLPQTIFDLSLLISGDFRVGSNFIGKKRVCKDTNTQLKTLMQTCQFLRTQTVIH